MTRERIGLDLDIPDFTPRPAPKSADQDEIREMAERNGFAVRHAPQPPASVSAPTAPVAPFDARSLRRTNRTAKLNIATTEENRNRFWTLAQRIGTINGEEAIVAMMDALERDLQGNRR